MRFFKVCQVAEALLSLAPLLWAVLMLIWAYHLRASAGYWPRPMIDDPPMDRWSRLLDGVTAIMMIGYGLPVLVCWLILFALLWEQRSAKQRAFAAGLYAVSILAAICIALAIPSQFIDWWLD